MVKLLSNIINDNRSLKTFGRKFNSIILYNNVTVTNKLQHSKNYKEKIFHIKKPNYLKISSLMREKYRFISRSRYITTIPGITFTTEPMKYVNAEIFNGFPVFFSANRTHTYAIYNIKYRRFIMSSIMQSPFSNYGGIINDHITVGVSVPHNGTICEPMNTNFIAGTFPTTSSKFALAVYDNTRFISNTSHFVYFIPQNIDRFGRFYANSITAQIDLIGPSYFTPFLLSSSLPRRTACITNNNKIVIKNPVSASNCVITVADLPLTNSTVFTDVTLPFADDIGRLTLMPDGRVFCTPSGGTNVRIFDPVTNTLTIGPAVTNTSANSYFGSVVLPDGTILMVPFNSTIYEIYDPITDTVSSFGTAPGSGAFTDAVVASDGNVYFCPGSADALYVMFTNIDDLSPSVVEY